MMIDRGNYEIYIVDYFDGALDQATARELLRFVESNPDIKEEFESYREMVLPHDAKVVFEHKDALKKESVRETENIQESNYETYFIGHTEGILTPDEETELLHFVSLNPHLQKDLIAYQKTKLTPDADIVFPAKDTLKKTPVLRSLPQRIIISFSVAAAIMVIFISGFLVSRTDLETKEGNQMASSDFQSGIPRSSAITTIQTPVNVHPIKQTNHAHTDNNTLLTQREQLIVSTTEPIAIAQLNEQAVDLTATSAPELRTEYYEIFNYQKVIADSRMQLEESPAGFAGFAERGLRKILNAGGKTQPETETGAFSLWDLAYLGVAGYNRITNNNLSLYHKTDNNGRLTNLALGRQQQRVTEK